MKKLSEIKDDKELQALLDEAQCRGVQQARNVLISVHKTKAENTDNYQRKNLHLEESERLANDDRWNVAAEDSVESKDATAETRVKAMQIVLKLSQEEVEILNQFGLTIKRMKSPSVVNRR